MHFQIIAILVLVVFYGCYYGKLLSQKKKGIQTDQIGMGKKGIVKVIEITMKMMAVAAPFAELISVFFNTSGLPTMARWIGALIALLGDAVFICSVVTMRDSWRAGVSETDQTQLVTEGIYQISRNPAFLGFDLVYLGILLMFFNWGLFVVSACAAFMLHLQIVNVEEDFLMDAFGKEYVQYRSKVNRYLGRKRKR